MAPAAAHEDEERRKKIVALARKELSREGELEIDDDARISEATEAEGGDNGCYVQAWAWLPFDGTEFDRET